MSNPVKCNGCGDEFHQDNIRGGWCMACLAQLDNFANRAGMSAVVAARHQRDALSRASMELLPAEAQREMMSEWIDESKGLWNPAELARDAYVVGAEMMAERRKRLAAPEGSAGA